MFKSLTTKNENPFNAWQKEMSNFFEKNSLSEFSPNVEVKERDKGYLVKAEIPGMDEKDINVSLEDNCLILEGERKHESSKEEKGRYFSEFSYGSFYRSIPLDSEVDQEKVAASYKDGVLKVELEKVETKNQKVKKIPVNKH